MAAKRVPWWARLSHISVPLRVFGGKPGLHSCQLSLNKAAVKGFTLFISFLSAT